MINFQPDHCVKNDLFHGNTIIVVVQEIELRPAYVWHVDLLIGSKRLRILQLAGAYSYNKVSVTFAPQLSQSGGEVVPTWNISGKLLNRFIFCLPICKISTIIVTPWGFYLACSTTFSHFT